MKHAYTFLLWMIITGALFAEERPAAQITFRVTDDVGNPVTGATIDMSTFHHWQPGEGFGKDISETFTGVTDEKGLVTISGSSLMGDFSYGPREKGGYYRGGGGSFQFKERRVRALGALEPSGPNCYEAGCEPNSNVCAQDGPDAESSGTTSQEQIDWF